jgi:lysophospholipase L1-like esterase
MINFGNMKMFLILGFVFASWVGCKTHSTDNAMEENITNPNARTYLALGDSYTIGTSIKYPNNYPNQIVKKLGEKGVDVDVKIIAQNAWRTDDLMRAIKRTDLDSAYDMVSLLIGVNNQYQHLPIETFESDFNQLLATAISYAGEDKSNVFVFSIPDYGYTPFGKNSGKVISSDLDRFNASIKRICAERQIDFFEITEISREVSDKPGMLASDDLHPSAKQYEAWVDPYLNQMLNKLAN